MVKKALLFITAGFILFAVVLFVVQGGFASATVTEEMSARKYIIGKYYEGKTSDEAFAKLFAQVGALKRKQGVEGDLGGVYFNDPERSKGAIKAFLGVVKNEKPEPKEGFEIREIEERKVLRATLEASSAFVRKAYTAIFDYAEEHNIALDEYYVEWFPDDKHIVVEITVKAQ